MVKSWWKWIAADEKRYRFGVERILGKRRYKYKRKLDNIDLAIIETFKNALYKFSI